MIVLILASGEATRLNGYPKQLLKIGGETILHRQMRQFKDHKTYLITHRPEFNDVVPAPEIFVPKSHRWKCETLFSSVALWTDDILVIHGDVVFDDIDINKINAKTVGRSIWFFWDGHQEVFGLYCPFDKCVQMIMQLDEVLKRTSPFENENDCGLAGLMNSFGPNINRMMLNKTMDIDTPEEYEGYLRGWRKT